MPLVLYGHSMGGLVCAGYVLSDEPRPLPDLLVLSAPALDADLPAWKRSMARVLTGVLPKLRITNGLPAGGLSRDPEVRIKADADPLNTNASTVRFGAEAFDEQDRVNGVLATLDAMPVPTYVFHGSDDPIVPPRATAIFDGKGEHDPASSTRASATSATTSPSTSTSWPRSSRGSGSRGYRCTRVPRRRRCRLGPQPNIRLRGAPNVR